MGKKGKKVVLRDYGNYLRKNEVKAERTEKPLMNIVVFLCVVISFICMVAFPLVKVLVWSNELGIYPQSGYTFSLNYFATLSLAGTEGSSIDIGSVEDFKEILEGNVIWSLIVGDNSAEFNKAIDNLTAAVIAGICVMVVSAALFVCSMLGIVGAKKTEPFVKWLSLAFFAVTCVYMVFTQVISAESVVVNAVNVKVISSGGSIAMSVFALGAAVSAWVIRR